MNCAAHRSQGCTSSCAFSRPVDLVLVEGYKSARPEDRSPSSEYRQAAAASGRSEYHCRCDRCAARSSTSYCRVSKPGWCRASSCALLDLERLIDRVVHRWHSRAFESSRTPACESRRVDNRCLRDRYAPAFQDPWDSLDHHSMNRPALLDFDTALASLLVRAALSSDRVGTDARRADGVLAGRGRGSALDVPPRDNAQMDGYAVRSAR